MHTAYDPFSQQSRPNRLSCFAIVLIRKMGGSKGGGGSKAGGGGAKSGGGGGAKSGGGGGAKSGGGCGAKSGGGGGGKASSNVSGSGSGGSMKAPGRDCTISRGSFESNPKGYFQDLHASK